MIAVRGLHEPLLHIAQYCTPEVASHCSSSMLDITQVGTQRAALTSLRGSLAPSSALGEGGPAFSGTEGGGAGVWS